MADSLTPKAIDLGNEDHDGGGIDSVKDIAGVDAPQEENSLQSPEMDSVPEDGGGAIGSVGEDSPQEENSLQSLEMDSVSHDGGGGIGSARDIAGGDAPPEENSFQSLEMDSVANDGGGGIASVEDIPQEEKSPENLEMDSVSHDNVQANETDKPEEEINNVAHITELEIGESSVTPSKESEIDFETDDNVGFNGETDYVDHIQVVNANVREYTLTDREEHCETPSKEMDSEVDDNTEANGGTDVPLGEKNNMAPSIELELDYEADDQVGVNTGTDIPLQQESCVTPSKEVDYEADDNAKVNGGTEKPLGEENNMPPSIELELDYEADNEVATVGDNTVTDVPLEEESCVAPVKELDNDYEADDQVVIDNGRRNSVPDKPIEEESFVAFSKELELDYEADDEIAIDKVGTSKPLKEESHVASSKDQELDFEADNVKGMTGSDKLEETSNEINEVEQCPSLQPENPSRNDLVNARQKPEDNLDDELEDGEIKDEDESPKKEIVKPRPRPECKFYARGRCYRGSQCRFLHPGVPDLRGFSIFTPPRPVMSGKLVETATPLVETDLPPPPPEPQRESAWERGLRAAKEMRRLSDQRKKVDFEYEEKKSSMSITQIEMDKEHDYNSRPATPMDKEHDYYNSRGYYRDDHPRTEQYPSRGYYREDHFSTEPYNNNFRSNRPSSGYSHDSYYEQLDQFKDSHSRAAPPLSSNEKPRLTGHEDSEYPWMENEAGGYSPRSTRSTSAGSSMSSRASPRYSSPESRRSTSRSRSRTPPDVTSSSQTATKTREDKTAKKCTAPLQKRLAGFASNKLMKSKSKSRKTDRENKTSAKKLVRAMSGINEGSNPLSQLHKSVNGNSSNDQIKETKVKIESAKPADLTSKNQKDPVKMITSLPKNKIKLTLKAYHATRSPNKTVLEKLGMTHEDESVTGDGKKMSLKRKGSDKDSSGSASKKKCYGDQGNQEKDLVPTENISKARGYDNEDLMNVSAKNEEKKKKKSSTKSRKEELMKQLKAVEDAITKKRDKLVEN